jgi:branched-chain amino acid transport system permease protein
MLTTAQVLQMSANGLMMGLVYALVALGLTLVFGVMRVVNFAHGELYMLGAFATYLLYGEWHVPFVLTLLASILLLGLLGIVIERSLLSRLRGQFLQSFIATLGLANLLQSAALLAFGLTEKAVPTVFPGVVRLGGVSLSVERLTLVPISILLILAVSLFVGFTKPGRAMRAVANDPEAAALYGVDTARISALCMALGSALAGAAGALVSPIFSVDPTMGSEPLLKGFIIIVIGGLGSIQGALAAAITLGVLEAFGTTLFGGPAAYIAAFAALIAILLVRPTGFFGRA